MIEKNGDDAKSFNEKFVFTDAMFNELLQRAEDKKISGSDVEIAKAKELSEPLFKAYIARDIFGDEAFYSIYETMDDILQKAIEVLK